MELFCFHSFLGLTLPAGMTDPQLVHETLISSSGKLVLIDKLLPRLKSEGHKVLIFSQMIHVLDVLQDYLQYRGHATERIDGRVRGNERQAAIDRFCKPNSDSFVFLLCTRAGGSSLSLFHLLCFGSDSAQLN